MIKIEELNKNHNKDDLLKLSISFFNEYQSHHDNFFDIDNIDPNNIFNYFNSFIEKDNKIAFVALNDDEIIGYITASIKDQPPFYKIKKIGDISGLMIKKSFRKQGIANQLIEQVKKFFRKNSIQYYIVFTSINNKNALELYRKCGMNDLYLTMIGKT